MLAIKNKKWVILVGFFSILLIYVIVSNFIDADMGKDKALYSKVEPVSTVKTESLSNTSSGALTLKADLIAFLNKVSPGFNTDSEIKAFQAELKEWQASRGYSTHADEYSGYSEAILEDLAKNGDTRALSTLAALRYRTHGFNGAAPLYSKAAMRGDTDALGQLALIEEISHYGNAKSEDEKHLSMLRTLVWYRVASLRGDRLPELFMGNAFITNNSIHLSNTDNQRIAAMADKFYKGMQDTRNNLGLGEFDNSVPDSVKRYFDILEKDNKAKAGKKM